MLVSEVFYSLQGEGCHQGRAAAFIRFFGCDLDCDFCDEPLHRTEQHKKTINELLTTIKEWPTRYVILTGGEPSLEDRNELILELQDQGYEVAVETNGYEPEHIRCADWITYSPKDWNAVNLEPFFDEIKLICDTDSDRDQIHQIAKGTQKPVLVQPKFLIDPLLSQANAAFCHQLILESPRLRLSLGLQRFLRFK